MTSLKQKNICANFKMSQMRRDIGFNNININDILHNDNHNNGTAHFKNCKQLFE